MKPSRIEALDLARFLALIGIILNHILQLSLFKPVVNIMQDYHAVMFVMLMGFLIPGKNNTLKKTFIKSGFLILIGFALGSAGIAIDVILIQLGILYFIGWIINKYIQNNMILIILTTLWLVISPVLSVILRRAYESHYIPELSLNIGTLMIQYAPQQVLVHPFLYSHYPVLQWISFITVGILLSKVIRKNFDKHSHYKENTDSALIGKIALSGVIFFVIAKIVSFFAGGELWKMDNGTSNVYDWNDLFGSGAYTGSTLGMISSIGMVLLIISLCMIFTGYGKDSNDKKLWNKVYITPYLSGATLSLYSIHVYSFTLVSKEMLQNDTIVLLLLAGTIILFLLVAFVWKIISKHLKFAKPGPLEEFLYYLSK